MRFSMTSSGWSVNIKTKHAQVVDCIPILERAFANNLDILGTVKFLRQPYSPEMETYPAKPSGNPFDAALDTIATVVPQFTAAEAVTITQIRNARLRSKQTSEVFRWRLARIGLHFVSRLPYLTDLDLRAVCDANDYTVTSLGALTSLRKLRTSTRIREKTSSHGISEVFLHRLGTYCPKLEVLQLHHVTDVTDTVKAFQNLTSLTDLRFSDRGSGLEGLKYLTKLKKLQLDEIAVADFDTLTVLRALTVLEALRLAYLDRNFAVGKDLFSCLPVGITSLTTHHVSTLDRIPFSLLEGISRLSNLRTLYLNRVEGTFTRDDLAPLVSLKSLSLLSAESISAEAISVVSELRNLTHVDIFFNSRHVPAGCGEEYLNALPLSTKRLFLPWSLTRHSEILKKTLSRLTALTTLQFFSDENDDGLGAAEAATTERHDWLRDGEQEDHDAEFQDDQEIQENSDQEAEEENDEEGNDDDNDEASSEEEEDDDDNDEAGSEEEEGDNGQNAGPANAPARHLPTPLDESSSMDMILWRGLVLCLTSLRRLVIQREYFPRHWVEPLAVLTQLEYLNLDTQYGDDRDSIMELIRGRLPCTLFVAGHDPWRHLNG